MPPVSEAVLAKRLIGGGYVRAVGLILKDQKHAQAQVVGMSLQVQTERISQGSLAGSYLIGTSSNT